MLKHGIATGAIILAGCGLAFAQGDAPPKPEPGPHGPKQHHPHPPMPPGHGENGLSGKGFVLQTGDGHSLRVQCGNESLSACMQAVQPLLDQISHDQSGSGQSGMAGQQPGTSSGNMPTSDMPSGDSSMPQSGSSSSGGSSSGNGGASNSGTSDLLDDSADQSSQSGNS